MAPGDIEGAKQKIQASLKVALKKPDSKRVVLTRNTRVDNKFNVFKNFMKAVFNDIKSELASDSVLDKLFVKNLVLTANDTLHHQEPETFTKEKLIERLLSFLGYDVTALRREISLRVKDNRERDADYKLLVRTQFILLEAEPINKDLEAPRTGASQVREWLSSRFSQTDYGIATDGLKWKLMRVSQATNSIPTIEEVDLSPIFQSYLSQELSDNDDAIRRIFDKFYFYFSSDTILDALAGETAEARAKQSEVTGLFYQKYIKYIFGIDRGRRISNCLLNKISNANQNVTDIDRRLFSVITMNRLIFMKFLQDKSIVPKNLLADLITEYRNAPNNPTSFYQTYLKSLFYEILSRPLHARRQIRGSVLFNSIPYLNGGLFTASVPYEKEFDIENDIIFEIIGNEFLAAFNLTYSTEGDTNRINPDILGRVFEKTINYITSRKDSTGKKEQGAYYTPTEITTYLCERTIKQHLFAKSIQRLEELGQPKQLLRLLTSYDDILRILPDDPLVLEELHKIVLNVKVLDPACGSGHFLKDAGDILLRINYVFYSKLGQEQNLYRLQKSIIINNLYGTDNDANAVEIAKLRLWMALIDSAGENEKLEALPNIEYNMRQGNSLVGFISNPSNGDSTKFTDYVELDIADKIALLQSNYPDKAEEIMELSRIPSIENMTKIKDILIDIYKNESLPELRNILKVLIDQILQVIQSRITEDYIAYVNNKIQKGKGTTDYRDRVLYLKPFHWLIEFNEILLNGGFDVIIENPPYEVLKPRDREFFETYHAGFKYLGKKEQDEIKEKLLKNSRTKKEYDRYKESFDTYQLLLKYLPEYKLQTNELNGQKWKKSDPNYYRFFIERSDQLLSNEGRLGMICPKGFIGELGSTALRKYMLTTYSEFEFREFNNRTDEELIFEDVDPNFRFVVFSYLKKKNDGNPEISYCYCGRLEEISRHYHQHEKNPLSFFTDLNGELCILQWIRSGIEFNIMKKISAFPRLNDENRGFRLTSARELDMTLDQDKFTNKETEIPLWEGSLMNHYSRAEKPNQYVDPSKWKANEHFYKKRLVIRTILPNSVRKFYSTVLPPKIALGNSLVYFVPEQTYDEQCYTAALLNSILVEYRGKQLLSKMTLNQFVIDLLPIPRDLTNTFAKRILALSKDLIENKVENSKREDAMDQIDALVFKLFGLNVHEVSFVLDTFRLEQEQKSRILMHYKRLL